MEDYLSDESARLKDVLKEKRDTQNISNQEIADVSGLSIHTVTNFFSNRSKAASAYTVGKICMALHVSFDKEFAIVPDDSPKELNENLSRISDLEEQCRSYEKEIEHQKELIKIKSTAIQNFQFDIKKRRQMIFALLLIITMLIFVIAIYLFKFDLLNPYYGIFKQ